MAKPDIGWRGFGVRLVPDLAALRTYIFGFPKGETIIVQQHVPYEGEAGVFYVRRPSEASGRIFSMTFRYFPHVVGDGHPTVRELIHQDARASWKSRYHLGDDPLHSGLRRDELDRVPATDEVVRLAFVGSNRVGGLYRDARQHVTPDLERRFDEIAKSMPDFFFGRFDIRFESVATLTAGHGFAIIEINGAGSEAVHVWDPNMALAEVYRALFDQQRLLFAIGHHNRARGFKPLKLAQMLGAARRQHRLIGRYPQSN